MSQNSSVTPTKIDKLVVRGQAVIAKLREVYVDPIDQYREAAEDERRQAGNKEKVLIAAYEKASALDLIANEVKMLGVPLGHIPLVGRFLKFIPTGVSVLIKHRVKKRKTVIEQSSVASNMSNLRRHVQMQKPRDAAAALSEVQSWSQEFMENMLFYKRLSENLVKEIEMNYGKDVADEIKAAASR